MAVDAQHGGVVSDPEILRGDRAELDRRAAEVVAAAIDTRLSDAPHVVLGLVGGRSVGGIYGHLRGLPLPWEKLHLFLADERLVPVTSDESNFKLIDADLLSAARASGRMPSDQAHPFPFDASRPDAGLAAYDASLAVLGGRFDIAILSAGEDGHTASLFPDHPSVASDAESFVLVENSPKPPPRRISASRRLLERTGVGLMVFYGEEKRAALEKFSAPDTTTVHCPSRVVRAMGRGIVLTDLG